MCRLTTASIPVIQRRRSHEAEPDDDGGLVYWTMGAPLEETIIINRCRKENSYEYRLLKGTLPELKSIAAEQAGTGDALRRA
jgi:hypothetical protein